MFLYVHVYHYNNNVVYRYIILCVNCLYNDVNKCYSLPPFYSLHVRHLEMRTTITTITIWHLHTIIEGSVLHESVCIRMYLV